jgi:hypothetical protein
VRQDLKESEQLQAHKEELSSRAGLAGTETAEPGRCGAVEWIPSVGEGIAPLAADEPGQLAEQPPCWAECSERGPWYVGDRM